MPTIKVNGTEIFYEDRGSKSLPAIVFSPLLFMDTTVFAPMVDAFADEYRVITYDHRGQGHSARPAKRSDIPTTTQDVIELIERLEIEPCHFVGNCLGAHVGLNLLSRRSDLLKSCTLVGAIADAETQQTMRDMDGFIDSMRKEGTKTGIQTFVNMMFGESFRASRDPVVVMRRDMLLEQLHHLTPNELENAKQIWHRPAIEPQQLKDVATPVLIMAGDEDTPENIGGYRRLSELIPHVTYKTIHHSGYGIVLEQPYEFINTVYDFLEKVEQQSASSSVAQNKDRTQHSSK
jgi:3-oxoadipate enol-lactonase